MQHLDSKMAVLIEPFIRPLERAFTGERVDQVKLAPHDHPTCGFLRFLHVEIAVVKGEEVHVLGEKA